MCIIATRGITAGSGFATTELRALLLDVIDNSYAMFPGIDLAVYVDDITPYRSGSSAHFVAEQVSRATDFIVDALQNDFDLEVSAKKSYVLASSVKLAYSVASMSRTGKLSSKRAGFFLGAPVGGGRKRSVRTLRKRVHDFRPKVARIHALRRAGVRIKQIVRAVPTPSITYGIEITGVSNDHLHTMRSVVARSLAPPGGGKNTDLILLTADADTGTVDPAFDAHVLPLKFWSLAIWEQWRSNEELSNAVANVRAKLQSCKSAWAVCTGPIAALLASVSRIGWTMLSHSSFLDDRGQKLDLCLDPPAVITRAAQDSVRRWRLARVAHSFHCLEEFCTRLQNLPGQTTFVLHPHVIDISRALRGVLSGRFQSLQEGPELDAASWCHAYLCCVWRSMASGSLSVSRLHF